MSGTLSKYILDDDQVECAYPDKGHCPIKCMSRSYAHMFLRFQNLEESIKEIKQTLNTVLEYVIRGIKSSSSSDSDKARDKKKATKKGKNCPVIMKSGPSTSSFSNSDTSEGEHQSGVACEADEIVRKVSQVIDNMAKVVDELQATAGIAEQLVADVAEMQVQDDENGSQSTEEEDDEPGYAGDFLALYNLTNEMNEVD